jgi:hypothetical protein
MLLRRHCVVLVDGSGEVTATGERFLAELGVDLPKARQAKRQYCRGCIDWTERRHHISGAVGAALADAFLARRLVARIPDSRSLAVTPVGEKTLAALGVAGFGLAARAASAG